MRSHLPWQWLALPAILLVLLAWGLGWLMARGSQTAGQEIEVLRQQIQVQREELNILRSTAGTGQNAVSIERASQQQLLGRIQELEAQNATLKEDILLFERLMPVVGDGGAIRVENFRVVQKAPGHFRYRLLLAFQSDKQNPDFRGRLQLAISFSQSGKNMQLLLPENRETFAEYQIELKRFLRREGEFELPESAVLLGVEARILQGDTLKSKLSAQF